MTQQGSSVSVHVAPGSETWLALDAPGSTLGVVFEDDGDTGYFYACDRAREDDPILDAVQIYVASDMPAASIRLQVRWSSDEMKAGLWMNDHLCGVVDFAARCAYSQANFPPPGASWGGRAREPWRESLIDLFG